MRRGQLATLLGVGLVACATTPEPRPVRLDPSNPDAPLGARVAPLEAFAGGPRDLDAPLLPPSPEADAPEHEEHEHEHDDHGDPVPPEEGHEDHGP